MLPFQTRQRWLVGLVCCTLLLGFVDGVMAGETAPSGRPQVTIIVMVQDVGDAGGLVVENTLIRAFRARGYRVLDRAMVARILRPEADLMQLGEIEVATRFGARLGADLVISSRSKTRTLEKPYRLLEEKQVVVSQADVGAKAISVPSGEVLVAQNAHARKPFDTTGAIALEAAAEALADKLIKSIMQP
jgi:hypothetical protein